jgi:hypothetical protein
VPGQRRRQLNGNGGVKIEDRKPSAVPWERESRKSLAESNAATSKGKAMQLSNLEREFGPSHARHQNDWKTRKARWNAGERPRCKNHPDRIVNRSQWLKRGLLKCGSCKNRYASSERRPAQRRYDHSEQRRWRTLSRRRYLKIQENKI